MLFKIILRFSMNHGGMYAFQFDDILMGVSSYSTYLVLDGPVDSSEKYRFTCSKSYILCMGRTDLYFSHAVSSFDKLCDCSFICPIRTCRSNNRGDGESYDSRLL